MPFKNPKYQLPSLQNLQPLNTILRQFNPVHIFTAACFFGNSSNSNVSFVPGTFLLLKTKLLNIHLSLTCCMFWQSNIFQYNQSERRKFSISAAFLHTAIQFWERCYNCRFIPYNKKKENITRAAQLADQRLQAAWQLVLLAHKGKRVKYAFYNVANMLVPKAQGSPMVFWSWQKIKRRMPSSGMWCCVALVRTNMSVQHTPLSSGWKNQQARNISSN
jgi:hypothetical protein